jgi:hypothetical protein
VIPDEIDQVACYFGFVTGSEIRGFLSALDIADREQRYVYDHLRAFPKAEHEAMRRRLAGLAEAAAEEVARQRASTANLA